MPNRDHDIKFVVVYELCIGGGEGYFHFYHFIAKITGHMLISCIGLANNIQSCIFVHTNITLMWSFVTLHCLISSSILITYYKLVAISFCCSSCSRAIINRYLLLVYTTQVNSAFRAF